MSLPIYGTNKSTPGNRPVQEKLGIKHRGFSTKVKRALTDFGSEESFEQAAKRFEEHYGLADGGNGLKEALEAKFAHFQFILDQPHLKHHLHNTADDMELNGQERSMQA